MSLSQVSGRQAGSPRSGGQPRRRAAAGEPLPLTTSTPNRPSIYCRGKQRGRGVQVELGVHCPAGSPSESGLKWPVTSDPCLLWYSCSWESISESVEDAEKLIRHIRSVVTWKEKKNENEKASNTVQYTHVLSCWLYKHSSICSLKIFLVLF